MNLGASALSLVSNRCGGACPDLSDGGYFADCYEVTRELVEDGVITAGVSVGRGGLAVAAEKFRGRKGFTMDLSGIMSATGEKDPVRILFSEVPGLLVQVSDSDYDYVDSQLLLQEIAYYPIAHPDSASHSVSIRSDSRSALAGILEALLSRTSEGED